MVLYEALAVALADPGGGGVRNAADVFLRRGFTAVAGAHGHLLFWVTLIGAGLWLVVRDLRKSGTRLRPAIFAGMLAESALLALLVGVVVGTLTSTILRPLALLLRPDPAALDWPTRLMVSLGAGLYEELLFRVLLVSALAYAGSRLVRWSAVTAGAWAAVGGALVFSAFHYVGPYGDRLELYSFTFRFLAGLFFSGLYLLRGFGITAWTHALYDVFLLAV
ncbi:MAG TPA: CPBP family glutamic-type intramembrane protease [Gemmatimonadales bacterium]|nr:CPBP family glutamic-type intramembrane protease [Gemmatimonadales bacterium]